MKSVRQSRRGFAVHVTILGCLVCLSFVTASRSTFGAQEVSDLSPRAEERILVSGEAEIFLDELMELRRQLSSLEGKRGVDPGRVAELKDRVNELEMRLREWVASIRHGESAAEDLKHFTGATLELATTWIHWVTIIFAVAVTAIGLGNFWESKHLKRELEKDRLELREEVARTKEGLEGKGTELKERLDKALTEVGAMRKQSADELKDFRNAVEDEKRSSERTRAFVQAVAEHFFSDALLELLSALHEGGALEEVADRKLRSKTKEIEARLFLRHSDPARAEQALRTLTALGSEAALPDLAEFAGGTAMGDELKRLAHQAIIRISERKGAAKAGRFETTS